MSHPEFLELPYGTAILAPLPNQEGLGEGKLEMQCPARYSTLTLTLSQILGEGILGEIRDDSCCSP
jgi:hypothetical protein